MNAIADNNIITADAKNVASAGAFKVTSGKLNGIIRAESPKIPYTEDFESASLTVDHPIVVIKFAYPH